MPRRPIFRPNPLARAYRTLSATSASDVKDLHTAFHADKATKDSKVAALEADKATKDTKMSDMESDMALLASQVSLGNVRVSLGNLATRVTSLETLGIKGVSNAVSWTNLTEINVGGQTITSGGTVQAYAGGGLEKISGGGDWNAGASSVQKIDGNSDGYVQFQWNSKSVRIGLKYRDTNYNVAAPRMHINYATNTIGTKSVSPGDWFRIRHYAATNEIKYQRKEPIYVDDPDFCTLQTCGLMPSGGHSTNHTFAIDERPLVIAKVNSNGLTKGEYYRLHQVNTSNGSGRIYTLAGAVVNWVPTRGTNWEIQKEAGQDYVTFYTEPTLTNGNDLYVDVSLYHVGARINDVTIVT